MDETIKIKTIPQKQKISSLSLWKQLLANLDWHYGITYYKKYNGFDGSNKIIKVGCDYQHYYDECRSYSLDFINYEAKKCIDSFLKLVPNYKRRCIIIGDYWNPVSEGILFLLKE